jgi:hypothetical protein
MKRWYGVGLCVLGATVAIGLVVAGLGSPSEAKARRGLRARVYLTQAKIPRKLSERGVIRFARRHQTDRLRETDEEKAEDRSWKANLVTVFNRPPNDHQFQVLFYNIEGGNRDFVRTQSFFVNDRSQKTFVQRIELERPKFEPNKRMEMVLTVKRHKVARERFHLIGDRKKRSGSVSFEGEE